MKTPEQQIKPASDEMDLDDLAEEYVSELTAKLNDPNMSPLRLGIKAEIAEKKTIFKQLVGYGLSLAAELKAQKPAEEELKELRKFREEALEVIKWYGGDTSGKERSHWVDHKLVAEDKLGASSWEDGNLAREFLAKHDT